LNIAGGVRDWLYEPRAGWYSVSGGKVKPEDILSESKIFTNGVLTGLRSALIDAALEGAQYLFYNPSSAYLADFVESFLQKITFTGSIDRQMATGRYAKLS